MVTQREKEVLQSLGKQLHEIAVLPIQAEKRNLWTHLNDLDMIRPMVTIDQIPWNEMNFDGSLTNEVTDPFWKNIETGMRQQLYKWKYMRADMVIEDCVRIPKCVHDSGNGLRVSEDTSVTDKTSDVVGHAYHRQIDTMEDIEKIQMPVIEYDKETSENRLQEAQEIFEGIIPVRLSGVTPWFAMWDRLIELMGVEDTMYDLIDRPSFVHEICERWTQAEICRVEQYEKLNLLDAQNNTMHCTYTYNSTIPASDYVVGQNRASDCWTMGMAQIFVNVSPEMHAEFEFEYAKRYYEKFGLVNYGCCEPLHNKIDDVLKYIKNVRKISISPWADVAAAAENIGKKAVLTRKPNPAFVSSTGLFLEEAKKEVLTTLKEAQKNSCSVEFVLKDLSSVGYKPQNLFEWEKHVMDMVTHF